MKFECRVCGELFSWGKGIALSDGSGHGSFVCEKCYKEFFPRTRDR